MIRFAVCIGTLAWGALAAPAPAPDTTSLVQGSVRAHLAGAEGGGEQAEAVVESQAGPLATTGLGPVLGARLFSEATGRTYLRFGRVPYAERPERFALPVAKGPWGPATLNATELGPGCIGSNTGVPESEDCLNLNIWASDGGHRGMPVIVYFHGGMNQHGSGQENLRQGDGLVTSAEQPAVFVNFDFRLGIFGWIDAKDPEIPKNLGLRDQQLALRWVSRNIAAFGGDPRRVMLMGQSEGSGIIQAHMVAPGSQGLFQRASLHSPPADLWQRNTNRLRTNFMLERLHCKHPKAKGILACLKRHTAEQIWAADWVAEDLSRNMGSPRWLGEVRDVLQFTAFRSFSQTPGQLGWHAVIDNETLPAEPMDLIRQGKWNHVPVLLTTSRNETWGVFANGEVSASIMVMAIKYFLKDGESERVHRLYNETLERSGQGLPDALGLAHMLLTDKIWSCDILSFARTLLAVGGEARVGVFDHSPKWDPSNTNTNKVCHQGAACHAADMLYVLPQDERRGGIPSSMPQEVAFALRYRDEVLRFASGREPVWARFTDGAEAVTFYSEDGPRVVKDWKKAECKLLDSSMGSALPQFMRDRMRASS